MKALKFLLEKDKQLSSRITTFRHNILDSIFEAYTSLGSVPITFTIALMLIISGHNAVFFELITVLAVTLPLAEGLKRLIGRKRPENREENTYFFRNLSFPSGHSANSFATAVVLTGFGGLGNLPILIAGVVAFSRVYLGQHFVSDVLAGATIGFVVATLI